MGNNLPQSLTLIATNIQIEQIIIDNRNEYLSMIPSCNDYYILTHTCI